jgi:hypothetical protein
MPDGERGSTTFTGLRTSHFHVVVFVFAASLGWWFWGDLAGAEEAGDASGPAAGAVDEPPSATGADVEPAVDIDPLPPTPDPAPSPVPVADGVLEVDPAPAPAPTPAPEPADRPVAVVELPRSERAVTDDDGDEQPDEWAGNDGDSTDGHWGDGKSDGNDWGHDSAEEADGDGVAQAPVGSSDGDHGWAAPEARDDSDRAGGDDWPDGGDEDDWGDADEVDPELGDPYEGWRDGDHEWDTDGIVAMPGQTRVLHRSERHDDPEPGDGDSADGEGDGEAVGHQPGRGPSFLPDGSAADLVAHAQRLRVARQSLALLARQLTFTTRPLVPSPPSFDTQSARSRTPAIVGTDSGPRPGRAALPRPSPAPRAPLGPPSALPPVPPGVPGAGSGSMGSGHGPLDASQLLERGRLWAASARGPGVLSGALYQRRTTLVEVAPAGVPGGRPPFTPD